MSALILDQDDQPTWRYSNQPFREAFLRSGISQSELERLIGTCSGVIGKTLGLTPMTSTKTNTNGEKVRYVGTRRTIGYELAAKIAVALDMDLVEVGV